MTGAPLSNPRRHCDHARYSIIQLALFASLLKFLMQKANFDGDYNWEAVTKFIVYAPIGGTVVVIVYVCVR